MTIINYQYEKMLAKANELDSILPSLLKEGNWKKIREELAIPQSTWAGPAADMFAKTAIQLCNIKSEAVLELPKKIRNVVSSMQENDRISAERVRRTFGLF